MTAAIVGVLERLVGHHVAPVARRVPDREQDRLVLGPRRGERVLAPRVPVDRVVGVLAQVRARLVPSRFTRPPGPVAPSDAASVGIRRQSATRREVQVSCAAVSGVMGAIAGLEATFPVHRCRDRRVRGRALDRARRRAARPPGDHRRADRRRRGCRSATTRPCSWRSSCGRWARAARSKSARSPATRRSPSHAGSGPRGGSCAAT